MKFSIKYVALSLLASMFIASGAYAATQSVTANIAFDAALSLTKVDDIDFGRVQGSTAGTYTITPAGVVSASGGGVIIGGTPSAAEITVAGSAVQTVAISTGTYVADNGVTPSAATCSYDGGAATACDGGLTAQAAPGAGKTLRVGVTVASDGTAAAGATAAPTFVVTVIYG